MPVEVEELRKVLSALNERTGALGSAVVTRSGVPLAWALPDGTHVDNFGTMAATLLGALEVIYSGIQRGSPEEVVVESPSGILVARSLTPKAFLVALVDAMSPDFRKEIGAVAGQARGLLGAD